MSLSLFSIPVSPAIKNQLTNDNNLLAQPKPEYHDKS